MEQAKIIAFLSEPAAYAPAASKVERVETHGAIVFLAGERAYKLKRAVDLGYLDFTTLAKREAACRHELERNRGAAPELYLGVVPVVRRADGGLAIGGDGEPVEWLVEMRRFNQCDLFDKMAVRGELPLEAVSRLAQTIAAYHAAAPKCRALDGADIIARVVTQCVMSFFEAGEILELDDVHAFSGRIVASINTHSPLLRARAAHGDVRLCHGDLHLRNIVMHGGEPTLFDAIEFDDAIARIDVLYDIAFLLMDLWQFGLKRHANECLNSYASAAVDNDALSGLAVLPLFLATRAAVRAMVAIDRMAVVDGEERARAEQEVRSYFALANQFLEVPAPMLVAVGGYSGTGKTTLARALAPELGGAPGALHLRSDVERKRMLGVDPLERLPPQAYSASATAKVYKHLCDRAERTLAAGHSVVVDATFLEPAYRRQIENVASRCRVRFIGLWLEAEREQLVDRVTNRTGDASDADAEVVRRQFERRSTCTAWESIDAGIEFKSVLTRAEFALGSKTVRWH